MVIFFTSDTHFGHAGALTLYRRPFGSVEEMDHAMLDGWNRVVGEKDEVWHLGDFAIPGRRGLRGPAQASNMTDLLRRLNGRKHLVAGNNDPPWVVALAEWSSVQDYREMELEGIYLILCHYPFRTWNRMAKGAVNLHGHSHGRLKAMPRQFDVGVDIRGFRPVTLGEVLGGVRRLARRAST